MNSVASIRTVLNENTSLNPLLSELIQTTAVYTRKVYDLHWAIKKYLSPKDANQAIEAMFAAETIEFIRGFSPALDLAINGAFIVKCSVDLEQRVSAVQKAWNNLHDEWTGKFKVNPSINNYKHNEGILGKIFCPSLLYSTSVEIQTFRESFIALTTCVISLLYSAFLMSMTLSDIYLLTNGDKEARHHATFELISNAKEYKDNIETISKKIFENITQCESLSTKFLDSLEDGNQSTYKDKINITIAEFNKKHPEIIEQAEHVKNATNEVLRFFTSLGNSHSFEIEKNPLFPKACFAPYAGQKHIEIRIINGPECYGNSSSSSQNTLQVPDKKNTDLFQKSASAIYQLVSNILD